MSGLARFTLGAVVAIAGCRVTLEDTPPPGACPDYADVNGLQAIKERIFEASCAFSGCHKQNTTKSELKLQVDPHKALVNVPSEIEMGRVLVVPGQPSQSYLLYMVKAIPPEMMDPPASAVPPTDEEEFMPPDSPLCREKAEALIRWIEEGALDN